MRIVNKNSSPDIRNPSVDEQRMIDDILTEFDFSTCIKTMELLNWNWASTGSIPSINQLKSSASRRIRSAMNLAKSGRCSKSTYFCSSGGLKASAWVNRYGHIIGVRLEFILTEWDTDGDY